MKIVTPGRTATLLAVGAIALAPHAALAATGTAAAQTTDQAGDGRAYVNGIAVSKNLPTADILSAGVRIDATTVTFFTHLAAAPSQADLNTTNLRYTLDLRVAAASGLSPNDVTVHSDVYGYETQAAFLGPGTNGIDSGQSLTGSAVADPTTGEVTVTYNRTQFEQDVAFAAGYGSTISLTRGALLQITGATSKVNPGDLLGDRTDTASAGPVSTFSG